MHPRSPRHRRAASAAVVLAVATAAAACGGDAAERTEPPPTTSAPATDAPATTTAPTTVEPPSTTTARAAETGVSDSEAAVIDAYRSYWDAWLAATDPPNPSHPDIQRFYAGVALMRAQEQIAKYREAGLAVRKRIDSRWAVVPQTVEVGTEQARLRACLVDDALTVNATTGAVVDSEVVASDLEADLTRTPTGWKVSDNRLVARRQGSTCD